jgi:hypothetical protein
MAHRRWQIELRAIAAEFVKTMRIWFSYPIMMVFWAVFPLLWVLPYVFQGRALVGSGQQRGFPAVDRFGQLPGVCADWGNDFYLCFLRPLGRGQLLARGDLLGHDGVHHRLAHPSAGNSDWQNPGRMGMVNA